MKKAAKVMLSAAEELAVTIRQRTGLPTTAGLDDRLLDSFVIVSGSPQFGNPGRWLDYLNDPKAVEALRTTGVVEFVLEIPRGQRHARVQRTVVRLKPSAMRDHEEFVSEVVQSPLPDELRLVFKKISRAVSELGYSIDNGSINSALEI